MATDDDTSPGSPAHDLMHNSSARGRIAEVNNMLSAPRSANSFDWSITTSTRDDQARLRQNELRSMQAQDVHA
ncbi:hypothetical protein Pla52nx_005946 [Stieleria varia]|uniref:hypothetical protein n=1 Tax=Stieleria varia TaxID=2528005 RepID=UPI00313B81A7